MKAACSSEKELKRIVNTLNRIERILIPDGFEENHIARRLSEFGKKAARGHYFIDLTIYAPTNYVMRGIDWDVLEKDIHVAYFEHVGDALLEFPARAQKELDRERTEQSDEVSRLESKEFIRSLNLRNGLPALCGKWRKDPFPAREYEKIDEYVMTTTVKESEAKKCLDQLITPLDGFLGQVIAAYF